MSKENSAGGNLYFEKRAEQNERLSVGSKILVVSDSSDEGWLAEHGKEPLMNGVKSFTETIVPMLKINYEVDFLHPFVVDKHEQRIFTTTPLPMYPQLEIVADNPFETYRKLRKKLKHDQPDALFIATAEGVLGFLTMMASNSLGDEVKNGKVKYTLSYTTNLDQYAAQCIQEYTSGFLKPNPDFFQPFIRLAYQQAEHILVTTPTMQQKLNSFGIHNTTLWPRGIDTDLFHSKEKEEENPFKQFDWMKKDLLPILIYFGRISNQKNIEDFLRITQEELSSVCGTKFHKVLIGNGPDKEQLQTLYADPHTHFLGAMERNMLAIYLRWSDIFVFPSVTDTFGNVILEAGASGVPTVGYKEDANGISIGSQDVIKNGINGYKVPYGIGNLLIGIKQARRIDPYQCIDHVRNTYSWNTAIDTLLRNMSKNKWKK